MEKEEKEMEWEKERQKHLDNGRKDRSRELDDFVRRGEWEGSKKNIWEGPQVLQKCRCETRIILDVLNLWAFSPIGCFLPPFLAYCMSNNEY